MLQHRRITTALAIATGALALTQGPAAARPIDLVPRADVVQPAAAPPVTGSPDARDAARGDYVSQTPSVDLRSPDTRDVAIGRSVHTVVAPPVVRYVSDRGHGFDWGDAGIGAGGAIALILLATGGVMLVSHRRETFRSSGPSALAS
jgi:hypothetical protein